MKTVLHNQDHYRILEINNDWSFHWGRYRYLLYGTTMAEVARFSATILRVCEAITNSKSVLLSVSCLIELSCGAEVMCFKQLNELTILLASRFIVSHKRWCLKHWFLDEMSCVIRICYHHHVCCPNRASIMSMWCSGFHWCTCIRSGPTTGDDSPICLHVLHYLSLLALSFQTLPSTGVVWTWRWDLVSASTVLPLAWSSRWLH